jgi:hypothetical protein
MIRSRLYRHADFRRLWAAQTISQFGSQVTNLALPLVAVLALHASAFRVSLLGTFEISVEPEQSACMRGSDR